MNRLLLLTILSFFVSLSGYSQTANITSGCAPLDVIFSAPAGSGSFFWDFQDGTISSIANPINTFTNPGIYTVEFRETQTGPIVGTVTIEVFDELPINILADVQVGCAPLTVNFTADPTLPNGATITNYEWVFGDGAAAIGVSNPTHTFTDAGLFFVSLSIETDLSGCTNTVVFDDFINVTPAPVAAFTTDPENLSACTSPFTVDFTNQSTGAAPFNYEWSFGNGNTSTANNPPDQTYVANGDYDLQLVVVDASGCSDTLDSQLSVGVPLASFEFEQPICVGSDNEIFNNSTQGNYSWDFGPNATPSNSGGGSPNVVFNDEGSFDVTLTVSSNGNQCQDDTTVTVVVDRVDAIISSTPSFSCDQPLTVNFNANTTEGQSFFWEFADGTTSNLQNPAHTFFIPSDSFAVNELEIFASTVTIMNASGCERTFTVRDSIFRPNALFQADVTQGCAPLNVVFSDASTSSDPISLWEWDFGDGTSQTEMNNADVNHTFNTPGEYEVRLRIENALGCQDTSYAITILVGETIVPDFMVDQTTVCQGESVQFTDLTNNPNIDGWHYETEDGRSFHCFDTGNPTWSYEQITGPQDVTLIVEYNGCFSEVTQADLITVNGPIAKLDFEKDCIDPFSVAFADSSLDATSLSWDFGDSNGSSSDDPNHTYGATGNYFVTLTADNPATGCPASVDTATVYIRDVEAVIDVDAFLCQDANVTLDGSGSQDVNISCSKGYTWYFSDPGMRPMTYENPSADFSFNTPGTQTIQLVVEDINGCRDTASQQIKVFSVDADFLQDQTQICLPNDVSFTDASTGDTTIVAWEWAFGDGNGSLSQNPTNTYSMANPGGFNITLIATDAIGCVDSISKPLDLYIPESGILSDPDTPNICVNQILNLSGQNFSGGGSFLNFSWDFGNGQTDTDSTVSVSYSAPGTYEVVMSFVEDGTGCSGTDTLEVNVQDFPIPGFLSNADTLPILCFPQNILFSDTSSGMDITDQIWIVNNDSIFASGPNVGTVLDKGQQTITLEVSTSFGCTSTTSQDYLVVGPEGNFVFDPDTICVGQEVTFALTDTVDVEQWTWFYGDGASDSNINPAVHEYLIDPLSGFTTIKLVFSGEQGQCETTVEQNLFYDAIMVDFIRNDGLDTTICFGPYPFMENTVNADQFVWDFGDGNFLVGADPIHEYDQPGTYDVQLTATNTSLGCTDSISKTVILVPNPTPLATGTSIELGTSGQILLLNPNFGSTYAWTPPETLSDSTSLFPFASPTTTTIYTITEIDAFGCVGQDTALVEVDKVRPVFIPNAFSPNGDGVNDQFMIFSSGAVRQVTNFQVFDRWGELVHSAQNFFPNDPSFGWDGYLKGEPLKPGVFVFFAEVEFIDDEVFFYKGDVTLLR